jgi:hypothetical protein
MSAVDEAKEHLGRLAPHISAKDRKAARVIQGLLAKIEECDATCTWKEEEEGLYWATQCGEAFAIIEGLPDENGLRYCCFCGRKLSESRP